MPDQRQRQVRYSHHHVGRAHEFADQEEERYREQRFGIHAVKDLLHDGGERDVGKQRADEDACHQRERHRHAEIAEEQEAERHQSENDGRAHGCTLFWKLVSAGRNVAGVFKRRLGMVKAVADSVDELLDREQRDQAPDSGIAA
jgi:hypothetical protein